MKKRVKTLKIVLVIIITIGLIALIMNIRTPEENLKIRIDRLSETVEILLTSGENYIKTITDKETINKIVEILSRMRFTGADAVAERGQDYKMTLKNTKNKILLEVTFIPDLIIDFYPYVNLRKDDRDNLLEILKNIIEENKNISYTNYNGN